VGTLRADITDRALELARRVDAELAEVPELAGLGEEDLVGVLSSTAEHLRVVHTAQMLAAILEPDAGPTLAGVATDALRRARARGGTDAELIAFEPTVLALVPPRLGGCPLPPTPPVGEAVASTGPLRGREALRLRVRWLQELSARAAAELARRRSTPLDRWARLHLAEVRAMAAGGPPPPDLLDRTDGEAGPVPVAFRLGPDGCPVPQHLHARAQLGGRGASRGVASGPAWQPEPGVQLPDGAVLVVRALDPGLAPLLPRVAGLVSESGSMLSHLAILAREQRIPLVVGAEDACRRYPTGTRLTIDGSTGEVRRTP
jgi:pyruvate,water dikinase